MPTAQNPTGQSKVRPIIEAIRPQVDGGRFPAKAAVGDVVTVEADAFLDGHDLLACEVRHRHVSEHRWATVAMDPIGNDRWRGTFAVSELGRHRFAVHAWVDRFGTWRRDLKARLDAGQDASADLLVGADLFRRAARRARGEEKRALTTVAGDLADAEQGLANRVVERVLGDELAEVVRRYPEPGRGVVVWGAERLRRRRAGPLQHLVRDVPPIGLARSRPAHGTFADVEARLAYVAATGFRRALPAADPSRSGRPAARADDGAPVAGRATRAARGRSAPPKAGTPRSTPSSGTLDRLRPSGGRGGRPVGSRSPSTSPSSARRTTRGCSEHPEWFRHRPDGTIRYAENPPKRYEDIYPLDFDTADWRELWDALLGVVEFWIDHGITRLPGRQPPHQAASRFWEWLIAVGQADAPRGDLPVRGVHPAQGDAAPGQGRASPSPTPTSPGATAKWELEQYLTELTATAGRRLLPAEPLAEHPRHPHRAAAERRSVAPSSSAWCWRPPWRRATASTARAFELQEHLPATPGSEEYLHSEKYEMRHWDLERPGSLAPFIARVNRIRRDTPGPAARPDLRFHGIDNDQMLVLLQDAPVLAATVGRRPPDGTATPCWWWSTSTRPYPVRLGRPRPRRLGIDADRAVTMSTTCSPTPATPGQGTATS